MGLKEWQNAINDLKDTTLSNDTTAQNKLKEAQKYLRKEIEGSKKMWGNAFARAADEDNNETVSPSTSTTASPARPTPSISLSPVISPSPSTTSRTIGSSSSTTSSSRINELRSIAGDLSKDKDVADIRTGIDNNYSGPDSTLEKEQEEEETSGNWTNYLLYGTIGLSALALGAYALSRTRK